MLELFAQAVLWISLGLLFYTYAGYPVLLWILGKITAPVKTSSAQPGRWPTVTVIISAYNEATVIGDRIRNLLDQDYPKDCLQILIGSDGSTDGTYEAISRRFPRVRCIPFRTRRGKASVLNDLIGESTGEYIVFTDAATVFYPDTIKQLIQGFWKYPTAAVIGGRLDIRSSDTARNQDGLYWRYEMFLKTIESEIGAALGVSGAIYAIRRGDYQRLPAKTMADDLLQPMLIRLRTGCDVLLHHMARASQVTPARVTDEFHRRVRTGAGILHVLVHTRRMLLPQRGLVALAYWSHKVLRLFGPWLLSGAFFANLWLIHLPLFRALFAVQATLYVLALAAGWLRSMPAVGMVARVARYFLVLNAALAVGTLKFVVGAARPTWERTLRPAYPAGVLLQVPEAAHERAQEQRPAA